MQTGNVNRLRVALVEDNLAYREQLTLRLNDLSGVRLVHTSERSADACRWLMENPSAWDLLVLDIFLAEGHGYQVLKAAAGRQPHQHAVFLTSYTRDPARAGALHAGADAVFTKLEVDAFLSYVCQRRDARENAHASEPHVD